MMRATSPLDQLVATEETVALTPPKYPIGTQVDLSKVVGYNQAYFQKLVRRTVIRRLRKTLNSLQAQGFLKEMRGKKMLAHNKAQLRAIFALMETADCVEVAGHAPHGVHTVGAIANQCYICGGPGFGGTEWDYYFLFRKTDAEGRKLVYIYPEPLMSEGNVTPCVVTDA